MIVRAYLARVGGVLDWLGIGEWRFVDKHDLSSRSISRVPHFWLFESELSFCVWGEVKTRLL